MSIPTEVRKYAPHRLHKQAKVTQRRQNFIDKFEAILKETSAVRSAIKKLKLEPAQERVITTRLGLITRATEYILRESGLKQ